MPTILNGDIQTMKVLEQFYQLVNLMSNDNITAKQHYLYRILSDFRLSPCKTIARFSSVIIRSLFFFIKKTLIIFNI